MSQATAYLADAETSIRAGNWDAAIEQLETLKQDQPGEPEVYQKLAHALAVRGKFQTVISTYLELIRVLVESEQLDPADEVVGRVLGLRPESGEARERRIEIENKRGNITRAVALSRELARLCIDQGDGERSIRLLQDAQKHEPGNLDISLELAEMFVSHGHIQDGANQYRKVANAFQESGNISKAAEAYRRMKVVQSDDPEVLLTLGRLYTELGKLDEAEQEFRSVLRHDLDHEQALLQLGLVCQLKGRFRSGILAFNKVLQNNPNLVEAKRKLGELHHSQGMMPEAVDFFLKAAQGYLEAEDRDDAIECFQIVLSVDENNAPAQQGLTNLGAPVQPKAFEPPQPPTPPEEVPEPAPAPLVSTPEPVASSGFAMERTERLAPIDFDGPAAVAEPEPPKPEPAAPKKSSGAGLGAGGRKTGLAGGGLSGGIRKGLVAPGGGDKPMLGGDKPLLGRSRGGIREGLGKKILGGPTLGGGGDKPVLGGPSGPGRRPALERPEPAAVASAPFEPLSVASKPVNDPLEDFSADMALEDVFSEPEAPQAEAISVAGDEELVFPESAFSEESTDAGASLDFGDLGSDLFDDSPDAPVPQASAAVLGALSFDTDDEEFPSDSGELRPTYASEKPVFEEEVGDDLFSFDADPDRPSATATPTLTIGSNLFDDDSTGDDLFGDPKPTKSLFDDEPSASSDLFESFEPSVSEITISENGTGDSSLFESDDPFGNLFEDNDGAVESSAETIGGGKPSLAFGLDEPTQEESASLSGSDFGQLFDDLEAGAEDSSGGDSDLFSSLDLSSPVEEPSQANSGLFSGDADSSDLFQDDDLFSGGDELYTGTEGAPSSEGDAFFGDFEQQTSAEILNGEDSGSSLFGEPGSEDLFSSVESSGLFGEESLSGTTVSLDQSSGGLFGGEDSSSDEPLFASHEVERSSEESGGFLVSEADDTLFPGGEGGLFDDLSTPESEPDIAGGLFGDSDNGGLFGETSLDLDLASAGGNAGEALAFEEGLASDSMSFGGDLFGGEMEEGAPLNLDLPMPDDLPAAAAPSVDDGGLFGDDSVGDLFATDGDFVEAPLDFAIPEPTDGQAFPEENSEVAESPLDFDIPSPQDEPSTFESSGASDLFGAHERADIETFVSEDSGYAEELPLDFDIPSLPPEPTESELVPEPSPFDTFVSQDEETIGFDIPMATEDEPLDFSIPAFRTEESGSSEQPAVSVDPEEDIFGLELPLTEPGPSTDDEPDEVMQMLEMTLPSVELAPEEIAPIGLELDFGESEESAEAAGFDFNTEGVVEGEASATPLDLHLGGASAGGLSEQEQLELAQTSQADALEASLANADVASKIAAFRKTLEENPENLVLRVRLADIHLKYGLLEDAVVQYRQVLRRNSDSIPLLHRVIQAEFWNENYVEAGDSLLALAQLHLKRDEHHDALDALQSVLSLDPLHFEARQVLVSVFTSLEESKLAAHHLRQLAETALTKGEISGAILAFQQLLEISEDPTFEERLAQIYESQGDVEKALSSFQSLLGRYRSEERWEEAARVTERLVELDPGLLEEREGLIALYQRLGLNTQVVEQQYQLARLYQDRGETARAVSLFEDVIKVQVENFDARRHLVDAYLTMGRVSSALEQAESLTEHYLDTKDHPTAISLYSRLVEADPDNVELQERLVKFYGLAGDPENAKTRWIAISHQHEKAGRYERAAEAIQKALELDENQLDLLQRLAILYAENIGDHQAALVCLRKLFGLAPEKTEAVKMYIDLLLRAEQVSEAGQVLQKLEQAGGESVEIKANVISALRASVEANPTNLKARFNYGELCYHLGDLDHAIEQFQQTRRHPDYELMSYNMLGLCFASKRGYMMLDLAIKQFKKGLETKGRPEQDYLETRYNLAMVLYQNNRPAEALAELKECYNVDIAYRDVRNWIQKIESEQASSGA